MRDWRHITTEAGIDYDRASHAVPLDKPDMVKVPGWRRVPHLLACILEVLLDLRMLMASSEAKR